MSMQGSESSPEELAAQPVPTRPEVAEQATAEESNQIIPEAHSPWSDGDKRNLIISFVGGLAANIGLVLIIGAAVGIDHLINKASPLTRDIVYPVVAGLGVGGIFSIAIIWSIAGGSAQISQRSRIGRFVRILIWSYLAIVGLSLLVFLGLAAGIGK